MKILVTGAAGNLGEEVTKILVENGHDVLAVDQKHKKGLPVRLILEDLLDPKVSYRLLEDCEAVVHLANHTNQHARPLAQQVLTENVCMTSNVLRAGLEVGVRRFVFASSIQAILGADQRVGDKPVRIPYLPLDDQVPSNPKNNYYALSKEIGERMLAMMAGENQELCCTALRFPFLVSERWLNHWGRWRRRRQSLPIDEAFTHLLVSDAASLTRAVVEREKPGYHVYFPAQVLVLKDWSLEKVLSEFYPDVPLRVPASDMKSLVDLSSIERKLEWRPAHAPLTIEVD